MKKVTVALTACLIVATAATVQAEKQYIPITISGKDLTAGGKGALSDADFLSGPGNQLVMVIDLDANTVEVEEWNGALTSQVDRQPLVQGTQPLVLASFRMAKVIDGSKLQFSSDLETGAPVDTDWDDDGNDDTDGDINILAKGKLDDEGTITKISAKAQGLLNDSVNGATDGIDHILLKGKIKSTGPAFIPPA